MKHLNFLVCTAAIAASSACLEPECEEKLEVVDMTAWRLLEPAEDPFSPPDDAEFCTAEEDIRMEPFGSSGPIALDVDTVRGCNWATVEQETTEDIAAGDEIQLRVFYFSQSTFPSAEANVAVAFDGEVFWSVQVPIPTSSKLEAPLLKAERDVPRGTKVQFHVGNHGDNSWNLLEVSRTRKVFCAVE